MFSHEIKPLRDLFLSLFSRDEFLKFIASLPKGEPILSAVPTSGSLVNIVNDMTIALYRRGSIDHDLFTSLAEVRPGRVRDIDKVRIAMQPEADNERPADSSAFDFFLSYDHSDKRSADELYKRLVPHAKVFFDSKSLRPGEAWNTRIEQAIRAARIIIVLISRRGKVSPYQENEMELATWLARAEPIRVVPVFLDSSLRDAEHIPYDLRTSQGITVDSATDLDAAVRTLLQRLETVKTKESRTLDNRRTKPTSF